MRASRRSRIEWATDLRYEHGYPASHREYIERCHAAEQKRPTPLLLRYVAGDYNCLHQDLYGAAWFPLQVIVLSERAGAGFPGRRAADRRAAAARAVEGQRDLADSRAMPR